MTFPALVDALLAAAWLGLAADNVRLARRERSARARLGPVVRGGPAPPRALRLGVLAILLAGAALLEHRSGGRLGFQPVVAAAGVVLALGGLALHLRARRALGAQWSGVVAVRETQMVVTHGPYAVIRHPLYLAVLLMAAGTVLAHLSLATVCVGGGLAAGIALKIPREERALATVCGERWEAYAARVPALVARPWRVCALLVRNASR